jgi:LmbE family N-acetylglucosaminyl deacetylase
VLLASAPCLAIPVEAQDSGPGSGVARAGLLIRQLDGPKRVLMVGAHPDDEDTSLLATVALEMGARTAYLSLNRGEGGQNLIGPEMGEGLGLIRTGELVAARAKDGGEQFFTRTYDFGYTKTATETLEKWGGLDAIVEDAVARIREFRPHVMVSVWSGTELDGHGQHTVAGMVAQAAFDAAGDPDRFPHLAEQGLEPWQPAKLYWRSWRNPEMTTLAVETGTLDPLLGRTHLQVAMDSRSQHRSQDMGTAQPLGPRPSGLRLLKHALGDGFDPQADDASMFAGVDTTLAGLTGALPSAIAAPVRSDFERYRGAVRAAGEGLSALEPHRAAPDLARALEILRDIRDQVAEAGIAELNAVLDRRESALQEALLISAGIAKDFRSEDDLVVPGQALLLQGEIYNGGPFHVRNPQVTLSRPGGWDVAMGATDASADMGPGGFARWEGEALVGDRAVVETDASVPYFLRAPRDGDLYHWAPDDPDNGMPASSALLTANVALSLDLGDGNPPSGPVRIEVTREVTYRGVDRALGEFRKPVLLVPTFSVSPEPAGMAWPLGSAEAREVSVRVRAEAPGGGEATLHLQTPDGWTVEPSRIPLSFGSEGSVSTASFRVRPGEGVEEGVHEFRAVVTGRSGETWDQDIRIVDYPHIHRTLWPRDATVSVSVFPVQIAQELSVGYIMGSGDDGAEALRQMGATVEELGPAQVTAGDFSRFDAVVLGVRAYETRPDLGASNAALLDFARSGGTVVVQYNKYEFPRGGFAPYPVEMSRPHDRVTDEGARVDFLDSESPVFNTPNRISADDFEGWVQERGLYFLGEWDERYSPLLSMADPDEEPKLGSLMVAPLGDGVYVYTGLAFFRQFPAGVPGAYRLFANLVSLTRTDWDATASQGGEGR